MTIPRPYLIAIVALLTIIAGVLIWVAVPDSCSRWHEQRSEMLNRAIAGTADDRDAFADLGKQRPEGCR